MLVRLRDADDAEVRRIERLGDLVAPPLAALDLIVRDPCLGVLDHDLEPSIQGFGDRAARFAASGVEDLHPGEGTDEGY
jgi:hypothetical protein